MYYIITFPTTHAAMNFDNIAKKHKLTSRLIPVPRKISANCGFSARLKELEDLKQALSLCEHQHIPYEGAYKIPDDKTLSPEQVYN